jgi:thioredoxin reductase (NADPH)
MLVRGPDLERSMSHYLIEQLAALPNVEVRTCTSVVSAEGEDGHLARLTVRTTPRGTTGPAGAAAGTAAGVGAAGTATADDGAATGAADATAGATATEDAPSEPFEETMDVDACFVFIGAQPRTDWLDGVVARDERGFILAGSDAQEAGWALARDPYLLETTVPGVFVAGDVRARSIKRVASAVGEGSMSVSLVHQYLVEG